MKPKPVALLDEAVAHFHGRRFNEAYRLMRRIFDGMAFQFEDHHYQAISYFVRVLFELRREGELAFYRKLVERWYERTLGAEAGYALAVTSDLDDPIQRRRAIEILERILRGRPSIELKAKATMLLAHIYAGSDDKGPCIRLIHSFTEEPENPLNRKLLRIWKCQVLAYQKRTEEAVAGLEALLEGTDPETEWYAYFSIKFAIGRAWVEVGRYLETTEVLEELEAITGRFPSRIAEGQVERLRFILLQRLGRETLLVEGGPPRLTLRLRDRRLSVSSEGPLPPLVRLLARYPRLSRAEIRRKLRLRQGAEWDDRALELNLTRLRAKLRQLGLPPESLGLEKRWVTLVPRIKFEEDLQ